MVFKRSIDEIEMISKSCQIVADTIDMITEFVVPGCIVSDLDKKAESYIKSRGARPAFKGYMGFPSTLCVSIEDAVVHGIPEEIELEEGQIVGIDCGAELNGFYGDHAKTFAVGTISEEKKKLMTTTEAFSSLLCMISSDLNCINFESIWDLNLLMHSSIIASELSIAITLGELAPSSIEALDAPREQPIS